MENEMTNDAAVAWNVVAIGNRGAAYDPPGAKRAFTYDHQPGNVDAGRLGRAADRASQMTAGDSIDRGLALLRTLQDEGFGVFQVGPELAQDATTVAELRAQVERLMEAISNAESGMTSLFESGDYGIDDEATEQGFAILEDIRAAVPGIREWRPPALTKESP